MRESHERCSLGGMRRTLLAIAIVVGLVLPGRLAFADEPKAAIQVLTIASDKSFAQAQALTIALKRAVTRADGWSLAKGDFSIEVIALVLHCKMPPDAACQKKVAEKVSSNRYIWGTLEVKGQEAVANLHLWENGGESRTTALRYSSKLTDASDNALLEIAAGGFAELMGATQGVLVVSAGHAKGEVFIDGLKVGLISGRTELSVAPGPHQVVVKAPGYEDASGTVTVRPGASVELSLSPTPSNSATDDRGSVDESRSMSTRRLVGYGSIGVGSVVALAGGYLWLQSYLQTKDDDYQAYRARVGPSQDACEVAKTGSGTVPEDASIADHCDKNETTKTVARILVPVGVVIAGAGAVLLLTDKSPSSPPERAQRQKKSRAKLQPFVGVAPGRGEISLSGVF
jgi:hypothetical protein